ncbi:hypothetical protein BO70DRAFT_410608 [Aspergillus heteromorphus CBS 117.55]|uniref:Uncharacterized protein n=1 Tax=Aspergillus heteromorphus CBS 117.55 TaxID=1448321 RepID=A0A317X1X7_9EURO|nr:uncharacterized protein BO70DRAFT_410608 [Aspergillus heteromorphus CBS 117.55]PWY90988.1 hypothetical protein BO70DRAFT_410608 [Aspergillus heteromorphus CBS 117.55]
MIDASDEIGPWIEHHAPTVNPAWAFEKAIQQKRTPPAPPEKVAQKKDRFRRVMREILGKSQSPEYQRIFERATTWDQVRAEAQKAINYRYHGRDTKNPFCKTLRAAGTAASRLEFLTILLPNGDYLGLLCGGLTLVYTAANRIEALREPILNSLDTLAYSINETSPYLYAYSWNDTLIQRAHELYMAILDAVESITQWVENHKGFRGGLRQGAKALFLGDNYGKDLEDKVTTAVSDKASAFEAAVKACLSIEVHDTGLNVARLGKGVDQMHGDINKLLQSTVSKKTLQDLLHDQVQVVVNQTIAAFTQQFSLNRSPRPVTPSITLEQVLIALDLVPILGKTTAVEAVVESIGTERHFVYLLGRSLGEDMQHQVSAVIQDSRFRYWLQSMTSGTLVVSGTGFNPLQAEIASPLSYMCALLMRSVLQAPFIHPITFFCRLHLEPSDCVSGADGIMRSLIAQLALSLTETGILDLTFLTWNCLQLIAMRDLVSLCRVLENILKPVRQSVILFMIDGIDFYDNSSRLFGMDLVMSFLNSLVEAINYSNTGLVFKLLLTSHMGGGYLPEWFPNRVDIPLTEETLLNGMDAHISTEFITY